MVRRYRHRPNPAMRAGPTSAFLPLENLSLDFDDGDPDEAEIRLVWQVLYKTRLPFAARTRRDWPIYRDHCFARILLDNAVGQSWRDVISAPAWRNTPLPVLQTAIDLGEAVLSDDADIFALNDASLRMRGKAPRGRVAAKAQPDGGFDLIPIQPERRKDMAGPSRAAGTSRSGGKGNASNVRHQPRYIQAVAPNIEIARIAMLGRTVNCPASERIARQFRKIADMDQISVHMIS